MNAGRTDPKLLAAGGVIVVLSFWLASYFVALTPERVLGEDIVERRPPSTATGTVSYTLPANASAADVGAQLQQLGVVRSGRQFQVLASLMGVQSRLSAGDYVLPLGASVPSTLLRLTVQTSIPVLKVTFPEGIRVEEMAVRAEEAGFGTRDEFLQAAATAELPADFKASLPVGQGLQGYLFPDTYILPEGATAAELVEKMIKTLDERFSPQLRTAATSRGLTLHQALSLAAIVEREAALADERPIIASVFLNRLEEGIKLDADPTVQFAVAQDPASIAEHGYWKLGLTLEDLKIDSPYNTYLYAGLTPGPITNPGLAAIEAVANPAVTQYFYFVADSIKADGSHVFAETLDQHLANVARVGGQ